MRPQEMRRKLNLKKVTICNITDSELKNVKGGTYYTWDAICTQFTYVSGPPEIYCPCNRID
ncbi:MAG: class I lanthipeptide [Candidatus Omnitrophota bacterium]